MAFLPSIFKQKPSHRLNSTINNSTFTLFRRTDEHPGWVVISLFWHQQFGLQRGMRSITIADNMDVYPLWERNIHLQTSTWLFFRNTHGHPRVTRATLPAHTLALPWSVTFWSHSPDFWENARPAASRWLDNYWFIPLLDILFWRARPNTLQSPSSHFLHVSSPYGGGCPPPP